MKFSWLKELRLSYTSAHAQFCTDQMPTFRKIAFARELSLCKKVGSRIRGAPPSFRRSPPERIAFARGLSLRKKVGIRGARLYRHAEVSGINRDNLIRLAVYEFIERENTQPRDVATRPLIHCQSIASAPAFIPPQRPALSRSPPVPLVSPGGRYAGRATPRAARRSRRDSCAGLRDR